MGCSSVVTLPDPAELENDRPRVEGNRATPADNADPDAEKPLQTASAILVQHHNGEGCTVARPLHTPKSTGFRNPDAETGGLLH